MKLNNHCFAFNIVSTTRMPLTENVRIQINVKRNVYSDDVLVVLFQDAQDAVLLFLALVTAKAQF